MKRKNNQYILYGAIAIAILAVLYIVSSSIENNKAIEDSKQDSQKDGLKTISTGSTGDGDVSIDITPEEITKDSLVVSISANTHSVDLSSFDLMKITTLEFNGNAVKPSSAPELSGHHSSGQMIFKIEEEIKSFRITIKGIPNVDERVFEWSSLV